MKQVWIEIGSERRRIKIGHRHRGTGNFDPAHRSKATAVVETSEMGEVVERLTIDMNPGRRGISKVNGGASVGSRADPPDSMYRHRLAGQPRSACQLPVALL